MAQESIRVKIPCRIAFPRLASAVTNEKSGKTEYSVRCLISKEDEKTQKIIRKGLKDAFRSLFGDDESKWPARFRKEGFFENHLSEENKDGFPLRDGDFPDSEYLHGHVYIDARDAAVPPRKPNQPECGMIRGEGKFCRLRGERIEEEIYSGCYGDVVVDFRAYNNKETSSVGISVYLRAVMKTADGERMSGSTPVDMGGLYGEEVEDDGPTSDTPFGYEDL